MPGITSLRAYPGAQRLFSGINILGCVTVTPETAVLVATLAEMGANLRWCSDNQFASDDDVVAALNAEGIPVFARSNMSTDEYYECMRLASDFPDGHDRKTQIIDDGADITRYLVENAPSRFANIDGITEQTTCGLSIIAKLYMDNRLPVPTININDCFTKKYFDNYYGVQESVVHGLMVATGMQLAGKQISIFGYGPVGRGAASVLRSIGARLMVVESDLLRLTQAHFDGFDTVDAVTAVATSDVCLTATGCTKVIDAELFEKAREGLILGNIGHGTDEYNVDYLVGHGEAINVSDYMDSYRLPSGRTLYSLCRGALLNLVAGRGNPPAIMSLTFTLQILGQLELMNRREDYVEHRIHQLPHRVELECARLNFPALKEKLYQLTPDQKVYNGACQPFNQSDTVTPWQLSDSPDPIRRTGA